jgi:hypothetical protein
MSEQELVKRCLIDICDRNGFKSPSTMTKRDFESISLEIEEKTGVLISVSTIKRLLNGKFNRLPQVATLSAISKYFGYKNWKEYKSTIVATAEPVDSTTKITVEPSLRFKRFFQVAIATAALGIIAIGLFVQFNKKEKIPDFTKASFSVRKNTSNEIPNTVVFSFNVDGIDADSFFIQQSWNKNKRVKIFKNNYTLTDIYYEPGYHIAKLIANDSIIRTIDISIPTDKWFLSARDVAPGSKPEYIKTDNLMKDGLLALDKTDLATNGIDTKSEKQYSYTFFPTRIDISSDNYSLKTRVRMKEVRNNFCPYIMVEVFCQKYFTFFKSTQPGCASEASLQFGSNYISGKQTDLYPLCYDVREWMNVEISVIDKKVRILFNDKEVFSSSYVNTLGNIAGLGFMSNGLCEIDFVELKGLNGAVFYQSDFREAAIY